MDEQNHGVTPEVKESRAWVGWVILAIVVLAIALLIFARSPAPTETPEIGAGDTTSAIDAQLGGIDVGDLDAELKSIDEDLSQL